jgi:5-formyltetrahydrofolate cyclo-ligase
MDKAAIRAKVQSLLRSVSPATRESLSVRACAKLICQTVWHDSHAILGFLSFKDEIDIFAALEAGWGSGKTIALPRYDSTTASYCAAIASAEHAFVKGAFGVLEPPADAPVLPLNRLDLILVPGLAFDRWGRRLGRGKGFYDRLLAHVTGLKCGVALDEQMVEELPEEPHDIAMDFILTPTRWLSVAREPRTGT